MLRVVRQENKEKIETLIENCGDVNAASSTLGNTILIYSAQSGNEEIVNLLIEKGGLISEMFFHPPKNVPNHYPRALSIQREAVDTDLPHVMNDEVKVKSFLR